MKNKIKEFLNKKSCWIFFSAFFIIFLIISIFVLKKQVFEFDLKVYEFFVKHRNNILNTFFQIITTLGNALTLIIISIFCIILFKNKKYKILVPLNLATIGLLNFTLKNIFLRERPNNLRLIEEGGYSFPSGHAMASTAFYGILIYITYKNIDNIRKRNIICIFLCILIILINISRVYVGVHYGSDVLAGTCFSICYLIVLLKIIDKKMN